MKHYPNRIVWITGASYGLGRSLAEHMAQDGWQVAASARSTDDLQALEAESASWKGQIHACPCDITELEQLQETVRRIEKDIGPIEIAVLNAGTHQPMNAHEFDARVFRKLTDINLMGTVNCIEALLPGFYQRQSGQIAVVSSVAGYRGLPTSAAYGMTKAGLINMAEALKPEFDLANIRIQVVSPGFVRTPLTDKNDFPMPFIMEPEDAARAFYKGLLSRRFEIVFPWQMGIIFKFIRMLPAPLAFALTKNMIPDDKSDAQEEK
ncbi:SDR family oxidoreductase [Parvularcula sp. IMCC14364]|uniref:SDR family NAD(P)-dependent oxidoreductase n=1 Tax=Parvularcula sp. IMCC14364 TaxID=3067902 RepID=UPI002740B0B6|nr:SDR family NAD(P)-dependent oxidoreductase [Parvularcula sp. IMCC14364]